jgi:hypothetical protein
MLPSGIARLCAALGAGTFWILLVKTALVLGSILASAARQIIG